MYSVKLENNRLISTYKDIWNSQILNNKKDKACKD